MALYDYICSDCGHKWDEYRRMSDNKVPEGEPCPECNVTGYVLQTIAFSNIPISHTIETDSAFKKLRGSKFEEKMNMIHANTPGSNLHNTSNIVNVK